jgi:hypothetical protein
VVFTADNVPEVVISGDGEIENDQSVAANVVAPVVFQFEEVFPIAVNKVAFVPEYVAPDVAYLKAAALGAIAVVPKVKEDGIALGDVPIFA